MHRDLAARNVLVFQEIRADDPSSVHLKVCDFGLSAVVYRLRSRSAGAGDGLPVRYMAPEAIERNRWTEKTDVWAFGVFMWEVATHGAVPYQSCGVFEDDKGVQAGVCSGALRLPRPPGCHDAVYEVMSRCWAQAAAERPTLRDLRILLQEAIVTIRVAEVVEANPAVPSKVTPPCLHPVVDFMMGEAGQRGGSAVAIA